MKHHKIIVYTNKVLKDKLNTKFIKFTYLCNIKMHLDQIKANESLVQSFLNNKRINMLKTMLYWHFFHREKKCVVFVWGGISRNKMQTRSGSKGGILNLPVLTKQREGL